MKTSYAAALFASLIISGCANNKHTPRPKPGTLEQVAQYCAELAGLSSSQTQQYKKEDENEVVRYTIRDIPERQSFSECMERYWDPENGVGGGHAHKTKIAVPFGNFSY